MRLCRHGRCGQAEAIQQLCRDISLSLLQPAYAIPTQLLEQESNSSPDQGALLAQLPHTWEGRVGLRERMRSQDHDTPSHMALDPLHSLRRPEAPLWKQHGCIWAGFTPQPFPLHVPRGVPGERSEETGLSRQYWVPSSRSCYRKLSQTPTGCRSSEPRAVPEVRSFLLLFPGLCGRQELQHDALQSAGAPDTRYTLCEQGGHQSTFKSSPNESPS